jgi:hypothetical protein
MRTKKIIITVVVAILVLGPLLFIYFRTTESKKYEIRGAELIDKIEKFRKQNDSLPNNVSELGFLESMGEGPYYEKNDSVNYIVFFNIGFDNTKTYYSQLKEWRDEP